MLTLGLGIFIGVPIGYVFCALLSANKRNIKVDYFSKLEDWE